MKYDRYQIGGKKYDFSEAAVLLSNNDYEGAIKSIKEIADLNDNLAKKTANDILEYVKMNGADINETKKTPEGMKLSVDEDNDSRNDEKKGSEPLNKCPKCGCETTQDYICPKCGAKLKEINDPAEKARIRGTKDISEKQALPTEANNEDSPRSDKKRIVALVIGMAIVTIIGLVIGINASSDYDDYDYESDEDYYSYDTTEEETTTEPTTEEETTTEPTTETKYSYSRNLSDGEKMSIAQTYVDLEAEMVFDRSDYDYMSDETEAKLYDEIYEIIESDYDVTEEDIMSILFYEGYLQDIRNNNY